jgi:hypothetical protein
VFSCTLSLCHPYLLLCRVFCPLSLFTTHNTNIHALGRIRTRNPSKQSLTDPLLRPLGPIPTQDLLNSSRVKVILYVSPYYSVYISLYNLHTINGTHKHSRYSEYYYTACFFNACWLLREFRHQYDGLRLDDGPNFLLVDPIFYYAILCNVGSHKTRNYQVM